MSPGGGQGSLTHGHADLIETIHEVSGDEDARYAAVEDGDRRHAAGRGEAEAELLRQHRARSAAQSRIEDVKVRDAPLSNRTVM